MVVWQVGRWVVAVVRIEARKPRETRGIHGLWSEPRNGRGGSRLTRRKRGGSRLDGSSKMASIQVTVEVLVVLCHLF